MPDTIRSESDLVAIFHDNTSRLITPQDLRDFVVSTRLDNVATHLTDTGNPHDTTASQVGAYAITNNLSELADPNAARTNLGLGTAATHAATDFLLTANNYVNVTDYGAVGDDSTDNTTAFTNAITQALATKKLMYVPAGTYMITAALDLRPTSGDNFAGMIGDGVEKTVIKQYTSNTPIFRVTGRYQRYQGFSLAYSSQAALADTSSIAFQMEDWFYFSSVRDVYVTGGYKGIGSVEGSDLTKGAAVFSCSFDNVRLLNHQYAAISVGGSGSGAGGTQNDWRNIYISNTGIATVFRLIEMISMPDQTFSTLNLEHSSVRDCLLGASGCDNLTINGLHVENVKLYGAGTNGSETYNGALIFSSSRGTTTIRGMYITYAFLGPLWVSSLTRSGTTATATIANLIHDPSATIGHGISVGDTVTFRGGADSAWNTSFTVSGITTTTITFTCAGTEPTPESPASGNDYITVNVGNSALTVTSLIKATGNADSFVVDGVRMRNNYILGAASGDRTGAFRLGSESSNNGARIRVKNLCVQGLPSNAQFLTDGAIVGLSRTSNVATAYTSQPHRMRVGDLFRINGASDSTYNSTKSVVSVTDDYAFTYNDTGTDAPLSKQTACRLILETNSTTFRARSSNVATLTTNTAHGFLQGQRIRIDNTGGTGYTDTETVILSVPSPTTFTYANTGSDEGTTADTAGIIMLFDAGLSASFLSTPSTSGAVLEADWLLKGQTCLDFGGTISGGSAGTQTVTIVGAFAGDRVQFTPRTVFNDGLIVTATVSATNTITFRAYNATAGSITPSVTVVRFSVERE